MDRYKLGSNGLEFGLSIVTTYCLFVALKLCTNCDNYVQVKQKK